MGLSCQPHRDDAFFPTTEYSRRGAVQFTVSIKDLVAGGDVQENRKEEPVSVGWVCGQ